MDETPQRFATGITDKVLAIITAEFLVGLACIAAGLLVSVLWTNWWKPAMKVWYPDGRRRRMVIRSQAFLVAFFVTLALGAVIIDGTGAARNVSLILGALTAGLGSPLAYDAAWWALDRLLPGAKWSASRAQETMEFDAPPVLPKDPPP